MILLFKSYNKKSWNTGLQNKNALFKGHLFLLKLTEDASG